MLSAKDYFRPEDAGEIVRIRRQIHSCPEVGFELPQTAAFVKEELDALGIPYTEEFGVCSLVATINGDCDGPTVGLRADMDALPVTEETDLPFASQNPGKMHACGHDGHTAMLLGAARALKRAEKDLKCRVKLLFQASEEGEVSGAAAMVADGAMEDIDVIAALHVDNGLPTGKIGVHVGPFMAACHPYSIDFYGKSVHATLPQEGHDALAMAVKAYNDIYLMACREISPFDHHVLSVSSIHAGTVHNVIADHAKMLISFRFYDMDTHDKVNARIHTICENAARELDGTCEFNDRISCPAVINDPAVTARLRGAAEKILGAEQVLNLPQRMLSEDFSHFLRKKPGTFFWLGTRNEEKGCTEPAHASRFAIDEDALPLGSQILVQYVLDYNN